jgi:hypothetical protein
MNCVEFSRSLKGNGILAFSDPAGAKACLALAFILRKKNLGIAIRLVSNKFHSFFNDWNEKVLIVTCADEVSLSSVNWLFTGTSHPDSSNGFELQILQKANLNGIPSFCFIDHRTSLLLRFNFGGLLVFPGTIFLTENVTLEEAIEAGIPQEKLRSLGNPYLEFLRSYWATTTTKRAFCSFYQIPSSVRAIIVYAPDPISLRHPSIAHDFDENTVLEELLPFFENHTDLFLLIKPHPLQPLDRIRIILKQSGIKSAFLDETGKVPNAEIIHYATAVIGFFSNFLVEANAMGVRVLRYFPSEPDEYNDLFRHFCVKYSTINELKNKLMEF